MDIVAEEMLIRLADDLDKSSSSDAAVRRAAQKKLDAQFRHPDYALGLFFLASSSAGRKIELCHAAAVRFKNLVRLRWPKPVPSPNGDHLPEMECCIIKEAILGHLLAAPPTVQVEISEALATIAASDFPAKWGSILPSIVNSLDAAFASGDVATAKSLLLAAASLFSRFRNTSAATSDTTKELESCVLGGFGKTLMTGYQHCLNATTTMGNIVTPNLQLALQCLRLCCSIFYSISCLVAQPSSKFNQQIDQLLTFLVTSFPLPVEEDGAPDALRAQVCDYLQLNLEKHEVVVKGYFKLEKLEESVEAVVGLLRVQRASPSCEQLAVAALRFLTTVAKSAHHASVGSKMDQICDGVIMSNLLLRDEDEKLFQENWKEFVKRDSEWAVANAPRWAACQLLESLKVNYNQRVFAWAKTCYGKIMMEYKNDPTNHWKEAIAAIYVAIAVVGDLGTNAGFLCDIELMLDYTSCQSQKILKSTVLWFLKEFNDQIPKQNAQVLLQKAVKFLAHESHVVRSYAAVFTDKQLMMKDTVQAPGVNQVASSQRYDANSIDLFAAEVISNLLKLPDLYDNPYLMKCMAQVLGIANIAGQTIHDTTALLAGILNQVCNNSKNPEFNRYLFEALAAVIGRANEQGPAPLCVFEGMLLPVLFRILSEDISDLLPYGFLIFSQLIDLCQPPLSHEYMNLFDSLLSSATWEQPACAHACSCLLRAFLGKIKNDHDKLKIVLQKFCTLVLNVSTTYTAFDMLSLLVEQAGSDFLRLHISDIWGVLFPRLWVLRQSRWEVKFAKSLIVAVSLFVTKYGSQEFVESIQEIDRRAEQYFTTFLKHFWIRYLDSIEGARESKLAAVASTKLICETNFLMEDPRSWGNLLNSTVALLQKMNQGVVQVMDDVSVVRLQYAGNSEYDPLKIKDPKEYFITSVAALSNKYPGKIAPIINEHLNTLNRSFLIKLSADYKANIS